MPRLRALTSWSDRKEGDEWDASDSDARILCADDLPGGPKATIIDRAMKASDPPPPPPIEPPKTANGHNIEKRRYLRRDLRAQE